MIEDPIGAAGRESRRKQKLGEVAVCILCGEPRLFALRQTQEHHVVGRNHDPNLTVTLCLNCHEVTHERMRGLGVKLEAQREFLERLKAVLAAVGAFLIQLGEAIVEWSRHLATYIAEGNGRAVDHV